MKLAVPLPPVTATAGRALDHATNNTSPQQRVTVDDGSDGDCQIRRSVRETVQLEMAESIQASPAAAGE